MLVTKRAPGGFAAALLFVALLARSRAPDPPLSAAPLSPLRVATFNIRMLGRDPTDLDRLVRVMRAVDADVFALQEVVVGARVTELAARLSTGGRSYAVMVSACGGRGPLHLGFLYDVLRAPLRGTQEFPNLEPDGRGSCSDAGRPGLVGRFARGGGDVHLLVLHLAARSAPDRAQRRREQWLQAYQITELLQRQGARRIVLLGDVNSTGYLDDALGERTFVHEQARLHEMSVTTQHLQCSEYYRTKEREWSPSLLDHVVATAGTVAENTVRVHGYCAELSCRRWEGSAPPEDHTRVSDHCPVSFELVARP